MEKNLSTAVDTIIEYLQNDDFWILSEKKNNVLCKLKEHINYAWTQWDKESTEEFWGSIEQPEFPTDSFIADWIANEDFDIPESTYQSDYIIELFG